MQPRGPLSLKFKSLSRLTLWCLLCSLLNGHGVFAKPKFVDPAPQIDVEFYYPGNDLGVRYFSDYIQFKVWAPTARSVAILFYSGEVEKSEVLSAKMQSGPLGTWVYKGDLTLDKKFYFYEVDVYNPVTGQQELNRVADPWAYMSSEDGRRSQVVNLSKPEYKPAGWDQLVKPKLESTLDSVLYEAHVRELTLQDTGVPTQLRGTYVGITAPNSLARGHLLRLANAGVTHIHLLPIHDFVSVRENKSTWQDVSALQKIMPDLRGREEPQRQIGLIRKEDGWNWGYDPVHFFIPDGSYATRPENRILEVRKMVKEFNGLGLRVVMDLVFNHTFAAEQDSILDQLVPGYFYRRGFDGRVKNSSCCADTASENKMFEKLMIDSIVHWAKDYKVDGFRFDLMNLHTRGNLEKIRKALDELDLVSDGVDGKKIILYGEGWNFGSLLDKNPGEAMTQQNAYGSRIATFNDRMRDALRGGSNSEFSDQGFVTGLYYDFNREPANRDTPWDMGTQLNRLNVYGDVVRIGMAGNLRDYEFEDFLGHKIKAGNHYFRGSPTGYAASPLETINYVSVHDGHTLWDAIVGRLPFNTQWRNPGSATLTEKVGLHRMALAFVLLSQGIPFIESGSEILRSKAGDVDSYDSGDFFNVLDFSYGTSLRPLALPPAWKNFSEWDFWRPRLLEGALDVTQTEIEQTVTWVEQLLTLRKSSPLFRLRTLEEVQACVSFPRSIGGVRLDPSVIVMQIADVIGRDDKIDKITLVFNVGRQDQVIAKSKKVRTVQILDRIAVANEQRPIYNNRNDVLTVPPRSLGIMVE